MIPTFVYPLDYTAENPACLIKGEGQYLSSIDNDYRVLVPECAPFYKNNFRMWCKAQNRWLVEGYDYYFADKLVGLTGVADNALYLSVVIINPQLGGLFLVDYQTIGGEYIVTPKAVLSYLVNYLIDPVKIKWDNIGNKPTQYPVHEHAHPWSDFVNTTAVANAVATFVPAMETIHAQKQTANFAYITNRIQQLDTILENSNFDDHIVSVANPHNVTSAQAQALSALAPAVDAFKAYGKTLLELSQYIESQGITQADLNGYLPLWGDKTFNNKLTITSGGVLVQSSTTSTHYDATENSMTLRCLRMGKIVADSDSSGDGSAVLRAGNNVLKIAGGGKNYNGLTLNDSVVITMKNISTYLDQIEFEAVAVTIQDGSNTVFEGNGMEATPLKVNSVATAATDTVSGVAQLTHSYQSTSTSLVASAKALYDMLQLLSGYVPKTRKVNGKALSGNITLTKSSIGRDQLDNTSDMEKPISISQQNALDQLADLNHTHDFSQYVPNNATYTAKGIVRLNPVLANAGALDLVTPSSLSVIDDAINVFESKLGLKLDKDSVDLRYFDNNVAVSASGWTVTLGDGGKYYTSGVYYTTPASVIDISALYNDVLDTTLYVYLSIESGSPQWQIVERLMENSSQRLSVGTIVTNKTGIVSVKLHESISFGRLRDLVDHMTDPSAHGFDSISPASIGLGNVVNGKPEYYAHPMSGWAMVDEWLTFASSGTATDDLWSSSSTGIASILDLTQAIEPQHGRYTPESIFDFRYGPSSYVSIGYNVAITSSSVKTYTTEVFCAVEFVFGVVDEHRISLVAVPVDVTSARYGIYWDYGLNTQQLIYDTGIVINGINKTALTQNMRLGMGIVLDAENKPSTYEFTVTWEGHRAGVYDGSFLKIDVPVSTISTKAEYLEAINSGKIGLYLRGNYKFTLSQYYHVSNNQGPARYATANMIRELGKGGKGMRVLSGKTSQPNVPTPVAGTGIVLTAPGYLTSIPAYPLADLRIWKERVNYNSGWQSIWRNKRDHRVEVKDNAGMGNLYSADGTSGSTVQYLVITFGTNIK